MKKIGIFIPGANGDILYSTSILRYANKLWGDDIELIWFCHFKSFDIFKNTNIKTRDWSLDFPSCVMTSDWKLDQKKKSLYEITSDLDEGYFVMAYLLLTNRPKNLELNHLSECTRYLFGLDNSYQWRPVITFSSDDEK